MPEKFGRYWLHDKIGHGGMAEIFRATIGPDPETYAFELALKRMHAHLERDQRQLDMFLTEADVAKFLRHPNLVRVYEVGMIEQRAYIAMESVWGHDLAKLVGLLRRRRMRFPSDLAVYVALQLLRALDYVHGARSPGGRDMHLIHRDVTPSNVFVTFGGGVKLGDFGVARVSFLEPTEDAGYLKGKAGYMPPEVLEGEPVEQGVDLWGVASTLYEMLTSQPVYEGISEEELIHGMAPPAITPAHVVSPDVDPRLSRILSRALALRPKKRPRDAVAFYQLLKLYLRDQGIRVDGRALASFVWEITGAGSSPLAPKPAVDSDHFDLPEYQVPLGMSPTQRFEAVRRRHRRIPLVAAGVAAAVVALFMLLRGPSPAESEPAAAAPVATPAEVPAPAPPVPASRPAATPTVAEAPTPPKDPQAEPAPDPAAPAAQFRALMQRGKAQSRRGRYLAALEAYLGAVELRPGNGAAHLGQATALFALDRDAEAEEAVNAAIERRPNNANAYLLLGKILRRQGDVAQARWAYERSIQLDPRGSAAREAKQALAVLDAADSGER